jgi:hypothetical protein
MDVLKVTLLLRTLRLALGICGIAIGGIATPAAQAQSTPDAKEIADLLAHLEPFENWKHFADINLPFDTYHSQGIVKIGASFYLTAIEGSLSGHLIQFTFDDGAHEARLVKAIQLTDPAWPKRIHPGGIDYDPHTQRIWCPLAEKTASTSTSILTIDPRDLSYKIVGSLEDHLGTTIVDVASRRIRTIDYHTGMYSFPLQPDGSFPGVHSALKFVLPAEPIEYQDCKYVGAHYAVCTGHRPHRVDLIHFSPDETGVATPYTIEAGYALGATNLGREAMTFEVLTDRSGRRFARFYFKPDDGVNTKLFIYDAYRRRE